MPTRTSGPLSHCEELSCERETGNRVDAFAVAVMKDGTVVGHVPKKISSVLISFLGPLPT